MHLRSISLSDSEAVTSPSDLRLRGWAWQAISDELTSLIVVVLLSPVGGGDGRLMQRLLQCDGSQQGLYGVLVTSQNLKLSCMVQVLRHQSTSMASLPGTTAGIPLAWGQTLRGSTGETNLHSLTLFKYRC